MNNFLLAGLGALLLTACSRTSNPTGSEPYPVPPGTPVPGDSRYPQPGETRYPNPYPSTDNSTVYPGQRDGVVTIISTNGGDTNPGNLPPGQAKKKYGGKSAKVYAPGQRKKQGNNGNGIATVISVPDQYASRSNSGQLFYNYRGRAYWKQNDGYYYLQDYNNNYNKENKNKSNGKGKGRNKARDNDEDDD
jgi:hypothetical protein